uniref:ISXO2-like transposase domain-containing protein n=1 Tax=Anopheles arabiensis TaxID=7173 RepID=A0A182HLU5_ANOAR
DKLFTIDIFAAVKKSSDLKKITADKVVELVCLLQKAELLSPTQQHSNCNRQIKLKVTKRCNACKWICMPTSSKTAILKWFKILREISAEYVETHRQQIGGEGLTVEIDESIVTKRNYHRGRIADNNQVWLVGGICRETKEIFLELVRKRNVGNLQGIIMNNVAPGTTIVTDGWRAYTGLDGKGYEHEMINHSENFIDPNDPFILTQTIENLWRWVKPFLRSKGTNRGALIEYIHEYQLKRIQRNNFLAINCVLTI